MPCIHWIFTHGVQILVCFFSLCNLPYSRYMVVEKEKCTDLPQNDFQHFRGSGICSEWYPNGIEHLTEKKCPCTLNSLCTSSNQFSSFSPDHHLFSRTCTGWPPNVLEQFPGKVPFTPSTNHRGPNVGPFRSLSGSWKCIAHFIIHHSLPY